MERNSVSTEIRKLSKMAMPWTWRGGARLANVAGISDDEARRLRDRFFEVFKKRGK